VKISKRRLLEIIQEEYDNIIVEQDGAMTDAAAQVAIGVLQKAIQDDIRTDLASMWEAWPTNLVKEDAHLDYVFKVDLAKKDKDTGALTFEVTQITPSGGKKESSHLTKYVTDKFKDEYHIAATGGYLASVLEEGAAEAYKNALNFLAKGYASYTIPVAVSAPAYAETTEIEW